MEIADICEAIRGRRAHITDHADEEAAADRLTLDEIYFSTLDGEIIEDYQQTSRIPAVWFTGELPVVSPYTRCGRIMGIPGGQCW